MTGDSPLTVLERLMDEKRSAVEFGNRTGDPIHDSIARDLEMLLNSRRQEELVPAEYTQACTSILNFGVPEFDQFGNLAAPAEQARLCRTLEAAIRLFEPRLRLISVRLVKPETRQSLLRFRIEAIIAPLGEDWVFEAGLHRNSSAISVSAGGGA
jgi:type VI secretion system lysozyme-like protein